MEPEKTVRNVAARSVHFDVPLSGYEIHLGRTTGPDCLRPSAVINGVEDGATSADGKVFGTYMHGLFGADAFRAKFLESLGIRGGGIDYRAEVERALDEIAGASGKASRLRRDFRGGALDFGPICRMASNRLCPEHGRNIALRAGKEIPRRPGFRRQGRDRELRCRRRARGRAAGRRHLRAENAVQSRAGPSGRGPGGRRRRGLARRRHVRSRQGPRARQPFPRALPAARIRVARGDAARRGRAAAQCRRRRRRAAIPGCDRNFSTSTAAGAATQPSAGARARL